MSYNTWVSGHRPHRPRKMSNAQKTFLFLRNADVKTREAVLANIADHYGITRSEAHAEITDPGAEHLLDYLTGPVRTATSALMQKHGLA
jgi:hypothetical protein